LGANGVSTPLLVAAVAAVGGFFYWRWRQTQDTSKSSRSTFKFPASKSSPRQQLQQESSLPRNKAGNNKKNKARKKHEKERRAQKREAAATGKKAGSGNKQQGDSGVPQSAAVLNYSYWDSGRNDSSVKIKPKDNKVKPEDVMPQQ
jgi:hypothetical protein